MASFILPIVSAIGGALTSKTKSKNSFQRILTPQQQQALDRLFSDANARLNDPEAGLRTLRSHALQNVDRNYQGVSDALQQRFAVRGMGQSGRVADNFLRMELSRLGDLAGVENTFAGLALGERDKANNILMQILGQDFAHSGTGSAGINPVGAALNSGLETFMTLMIMDRMLGGGMRGGII